MFVWWQCFDATEPQYSASGEEQLILFSKFANFLLFVSASYSMKNIEADTDVLAMTQLQMYNYINRWHGSTSTTNLSRHQKSLHNLPNMTA